MSRNFQPPRPTGTDPASRFFQAVWDELWSGRRELISTPEVSFDKTTRGVIPRLNSRPSAGSTRFYPFKVYPVTNGTDSWRSFAVRSGFIGYRSKYKLPTGGRDPYWGEFSSKYEQPLFVADGSDGIVSSAAGGIRNFETATPAPISGFTTVQLSGTTTATGSGPTLFVLTNDSASPGNWTGCAIWAEVTDVAVTGATVAIKARMLLSSGGLTGGFPNSAENIIPLAFIFPITAFGIYDPSTPASLVPMQMAFDHVLNRYPASGSWRGNWDDDSLSGQIFYPGDLVSVLDSGITSLFAHVGTSLESSTPNGTGNWKIAAG